MALVHPGDGRDDGRMNASWHQDNKLCRTSSHEDRLRWHATHALVCGCRPMPAAIAAELARRSLAQ